MFIISLTYIKPIEEVEKYLAAHIDFLKKYYEAGNLICSGRKNPRTGGIIICKANNIEEVKAIINEDPFEKNNIANYEIVEFQPTMYTHDFKVFVE